MTTIFANNCSDGVVFGIINVDVATGSYVIQSINQLNLSAIIAGSSSVIMTINDMVTQYASNKSNIFVRSSVQDAPRDINDSLTNIFTDIHDYFVKNSPWFIPELHAASIVVYDGVELGLTIGRRKFHVMHDFVSVGSETDTILPHLFYTTKAYPRPTVDDFVFQLNENIADYQKDHNRSVPEITFQKILDV